MTFACALQFSKYFKIRVLTFIQQITTEGCFVVIALTVCYVEQNRPQGAYHLVEEEDVKRIIEQMILTKTIMH